MPWSACFWSPPRFGWRVEVEASAAAARRAMRALANPRDAEFLRRYFKTGPGEYGEGDRFLGIRVPMTRRVASQFRSMPFAQVLALLQSPWHEERLLALLLLVNRYERGDDATRTRVYLAYMANLGRVNNWDLVDLSAPGIVGAYLAKRSRRVLDALARSHNVWERRIAVLATFWFIREGELEPSLRLAARLLDDPHDLMHKATGWMLREAAKVDRVATERFLRAHQRAMPRTMLRYAIERFTPAERRRYLDGTA